MRSTPMDAWLSGDYPPAIAHYGIAARRTASLPEWNYLLTQAAGSGRASEVP